MVINSIRRCILNKVESSEELKNLSEKINNDIVKYIKHTNKEESKGILTKSKKKLNDIISKYIDKKEGHY